MGGDWNDKASLDPNNVVGAKVDWLGEAMQEDDMKWNQRRRKFGMVIGGIVAAMFVGFTVYIIVMVARIP